MNASTSTPPLPVVPPAPRRGVGARLLRFALIGLAVLYVAGVAGGYYWLHSLRKIDGVGLLDVALFRRGAVLRAVSTQQLGEAKRAWEQKQYQAAYVWYTAALRNDPDNIAGRLEAGRFLGSVGAGGMAVDLLEDGLVRHPDDPALAEATFTELFALGRDRQALDLLRKQYPAGAAGAANPLLPAFEIQATLRLEGAVAARRLLDQHPELRQNRVAAPLVAQVLWESNDRPGAVDLLANSLRTPPDSPAPYSKLAGWQEAMGQVPAAVATLQKACAQFPHDSSVRLQLLGERPFGSPDFQRELNDYFRDFAGRPDAALQLASLCGTKGWVELARALFVAGANQRQDLAVFALSYADALLMHQRMSEFTALLDQLDGQIPDSNTGLMTLLRQRQVLAAAAAGDHENTRGYARRLAAALHNDPDQLEDARRRFLRMGLTEAAAELSAVQAAAKPAPRKS